MSLSTIIFSLGAIVLLSAAFLFYHYFHFRFVSFIRNEHTSDMDPASIEGYTDKYYYLPGETIIFYLHSEHANNTLILRRMNGPYQYEDISSQEFPSVLQEQSGSESEYGCNWKPTLNIALNKTVKPGYYQALLQHDNEQYPIYFIIGSSERAEIVIIAPVSTWMAYNPYGGKSLYQNKFE